jgi:hypothetical protein
VFSPFHHCGAGWLRGNRAQPPASEAKCMPFA